MKVKLKYSVPLIFLLTLIIFSSACGKVSQEVGLEEDQKKSFDLNYFIEVQNTKNIETLIKTQSYVNTSNLICVNDTSVFVAVNGLVFDAKEVKFDDLSWGKGVLLSDVQKITTQNQGIIYKSKSFDRDDVERTQPDYKWTNLKFDNLKLNWNISSTKIKTGYPVYLIKIFTDKDKYLLKILEAEFVSGNEKINVGEITTYDTFISILFLMNLNQGIDQKAKDKTINIKEISAFYDKSFFNMLKYSLAPNKIKSFDIKNPIFTFDRELEKELLNIFSMYKKNKKELISYLNNYKKELISKEALISLKNNIEKNNNEKELP
jgi:hypothetical protein